MAYFMRDEFQDIDMDKVIRMCIIHDLGEAFTGDISVFEKTQVNANTEKEVLYNWVELLPEKYADDKVEFSEYLKILREEIRKDTFEKLGER